MTSKTPSAIGKMIHRFRGDIPHFEVTTFSSYYDFGTEYYAGSKVGGESYTLMANTWRFIRFHEKDDDNMNKESEVIDELIEDERHDCDKPKIEEWQQGERPPLDVWLEFYPGEFAPVYCVAKYIFTGDELGIFVRRTGKCEETARWNSFRYRRWIDPKEKALAEIAFALATKVMGEDAAKEIDFNHDNDFTCDYRNMAQAIIDGCIGHVEYTGKR
ncbi:hypothetical protein MZG96_12705 [Escherichia coli]|nr:hypothetical protein [Escherichia coli]MCK3282379.1 hypothetical protein [Escherichia coli]